MTPGRIGAVVGHRAQRLPLPPQQARVRALEQAPVGVGEHRLAGAVGRRALAQGGEPLEVGTLATREAAGIGHVGDPGHHGRLARRRRAHQHGELAVLAELDAREPAAVERARSRSTRARNAASASGATPCSPHAAEKRAQWRSTARTRPSTTSHESAASSAVIRARR